MRMKEAAMVQDIAPPHVNWKFTFRISQKFRAEFRAREVNNFIRHEKYSSTTSGWQLKKWGYIKRFHSDGECV